MEKSVYGEKDDMIFPGAETRGLSNAIVGARLICVNAQTVLSVVLCSCLRGAQAGSVLMVKARGGLEEMLVWVSSSTQG
jgi:hypothetical protein